MPPTSCWRGKRMIYLQNLTNEFCELRKQYIDAKFKTMNHMQKKAIYNVDGPVLV